MNTFVVLFYLWWLGTLLYVAYRLGGAWVS